MAVTFDRKYNAIYFNKGDLFDLGVGYHEIKHSGIYEFTHYKNIKDKVFYNSFPVLAPKATNINKKLYPNREEYRGHLIKGK